MAFFPQNTATVPVACSSGKSLFLPAEDYTGLLQEFPWDAFLRSPNLTDETQKLQIIFLQSLGATLI